MAVTNLPFIQQQIIQYGMTIYLALGLIGNIFNCIIFTRPLYRRTPTSIYLLSLSIVAMIHLIWSISPLIYTLDHIDLQTQSTIYCKLRLYVSHCLAQSVRYIVVLACIDRFFVTRTNVHIRALNSYKMVLKLVLITCITWFVVPIHIPVLIDIRNGVCGMIGLYRIIYAFYLIIVAGILPPVLMIIFSILTIHSYHRRHANHIYTRQRDRDFMCMVIGEVFVNIFSLIPYSSNLIYGVFASYVTDKSAQRIEIESFLSFFTQFLLYFISVTPFYIFILTSKPFRTEFIRLFVQSWHKFLLRQVQIVPLNEQNRTTTSNGRIIHDTRQIHIADVQ